jgi:hypothetical protein|tara:strand:- start:753 stop:1421 length:669 start_codon:yes stop_codon:yes gene_type:complete
MSNYFRYLPDFEYVSRFDDKSSSDFVLSKNIFRKVRLREDVAGNMFFFDKYIVKGDSRPDNVAEELYDDPALDWIILTCNNIINVRDEWPMSQRMFNSYLEQKYGSMTNAEKVKHYKTTQIVDGIGRVVLPAGKIVDKDFTFTYYDSGRETETIATNITTEVTFKDFEEQENDAKREINVIRPIHVQTFIDDLKSTMEYKRGGTQYMSPTLKRGSNINNNIL